MNLIERTIFAQAWVADWAASKKTPLNLNRLRWSLREFAPLVNYRAETTLLIECCRAEAKASVILGCVRELIENFGANPNVAAIGEENSFHDVTPLIIASAKGMPHVVRYLLDAGASPLTVGYAIFSWGREGKGSVKGLHTPLEFAKAMREAEFAQWGGDYGSLEEFDECIALLEEAENATRRPKRTVLPPGAHNAGRRP
jgi:ankyrin repeat protein